MTPTKRKVFTIEEKAAIIWRLENGEANSDLAREFRVSHSTISTMWKNREKIREAFESKSLKIKRVRTSQYPDIEEALLRWFKSQRSNNVPLNGPLLQAKAEEIGRALGKSNFHASDSWIYRFRIRNNIVVGKVSGEAASVPQTACNDWLNSVWPQLRKGYSNSEIFNADETGLFYKLTPDKTLKFKGEKCVGGKLSKDRVTVLVAANMDGSEKRKLLVIGKSKNPRCFKNVKALPVEYEANMKAWMTSNIFEIFLRKWDLELKRKNKKILLIVDNCPSHPHVEKLSAIKLIFLPPNATSILQPVDQGVIRSLKSHFRRILVLRMMRDIEVNKQTKLSLLDAIEMISTAWNRVSQRTIQNCFKHAGVTEEPQYHDEDFDEEDNIPIAEWIKVYGDLTNSEDWDEFVCVDADVTTAEEQTVEEIAAEVLEENSDSNEDDSDPDFQPPTTAEVMTAVETIKRFAQFSEHDEHLLNAIFKIERKIENSYVRSNYKKQTKISDFFKTS